MPTTEKSAGSVWSWKIAWRLPLIVPGTVSGKRHAIFQLHTLPADFSVVGTVHSHPSGVYEPSDEDRALFNKFGGIHLITGYPYTEDSWAAWTNKGQRTALKVVT